MTWDIRRLDSSDRESFLDFYGRRVGRERIEVRYDWLYRANPHGEALTWGAVHRTSGRILGVTSIFPRRMWIRDRVVLGSRGGDSYVDPDFRRRGIAKELHDVSRTEMWDEGIELHYGLPVPNNLGAFRKIGAVIPGNFHVMRFTLSSVPVLSKMHLGRTVSNGVARVVDLPLRALARRRVKPSNRPAGKLTVVREFDDRFDALNDALLPSYDVCCARDREYLEWRYIANPMRHLMTTFGYERDGELRGFVVLEERDDVCIVFDLFLRDEPADAADVLGFVVEHALDKGQTQIRSMGNLRSRRSDGLRAGGFRPGLRPIPNPLMVLSAPGARDTTTVDAFENWYLTYGDEDRDALGSKG